MDNDVDIVVTGRHTQITERFRTHLEEKLSKVPHLLPRVSRIDVVVTHEKAVRNCDAVEITCYAKGPVIRAEACTDDLYASLDIALDKLFERLRLTLEVDGGLRLADGDVDRHQLGAIETMKQQQIPAVVDDGDCDVPVVLAGFGFSGGGHPPGRFERQRAPGRQLLSGGAGGDGECKNDSQAGERANHGGW